MKLAPLMAVLLLSTSTYAQAPAVPAADDASAIQALVTRYAQTLAACSAEEYAGLFAPDEGSFSSGFRGRVVGRDRLIALVQSERHCTAPPSAAPAARPGGASGPPVVLEVTSTGVRGIADLGGAGQYQDDYVKTPQGWKFLSRTVLTPAEKAAGLDARELLAIQRLAGADLADYYVADQNGIKRLRTSGVAIAVSAGAVTGHAYLKDGGYYDDVYEKIAPGQWRIKSRSYVAAAAR